MNRFYYYEGNIYETEERLKKALENAYYNKKFDVIETQCDWDEFENCFLFANNGVDDMIAILDTAKNGYQGLIDSLEYVDEECKEEIIKFLNQNLHSKDKITEMLIDYETGICIKFEQFGTKEEEVREKFAQFCRDWEALPAEPEGFNKEQEEDADKLLEETAKEIIGVIND